LKKELKQRIAAGLLITPMLLSTAPLSIQAGEQFSYDHGAQVNTRADGRVAANTMSSTTFGGTQTFDYSGNPNDSDNDSDADPYG
jgi:hypothetical protein